MKCLRSGGHERPRLKKMVKRLGKEWFGNRARDNHVRNVTRSRFATAIGAMVVLFYLLSPSQQFSK